MKTPMESAKKICKLGFSNTAIYFMYFLNTHIVVDGPAYLVLLDGKSITRWKFKQALASPLQIPWMHAVTISSCSRVGSLCAVRTFLYLVINSDKFMFPDIVPQIASRFYYSRTVIEVLASLNLSPFGTARSTLAYALELTGVDLIISDT